MGGVGRSPTPAPPTPSARDRFRGALLGLAVGDALGAPVEFSPPGSFEAVEEMRGGGAFGLPAGYWTDDTSMALCLAESLIECESFDAADQMRRYVRWFRTGHLSSTGKFFDIGVSTRQALVKFEESGDAFSGSARESSSGNGSLMRLAPVALFYAGAPAAAIDMAGESSRTTHPSPICIDACRYFAGLMVGALGGAAKHNLLAPRFHPSAGRWSVEELHSRVGDVADGSFQRREPPEIRGTGFVVQSLEAALWAFERSTMFEEGCRLPVNLGDDADTTAAIYGQLAGAYYGAGGIPARWLEELAHRAMIESFADRLFALAAAPETA